MAQQIIYMLTGLFASSQTPNSQAIRPQDNNTTLFTTVEERQQEEGNDQGDDHTPAVPAQDNSHLIKILDSANFEEVLPLAETFILSRVSDVHSLYIAHAGVGFRLPFKPALLIGCRHRGTQASVNLVLTSP